ncbi:ABC transporter protein [Halomicronema hongdechloris C2206]|uniref:ABC transporter protein n=1 Tax=Halomicronema hongdechloris C2206 TaxID=1641165 RepID=A0A1Z3HGH1_9CYAN|nr:ABC transporter ATP-binding protein [Halomicronema hongdechloris]ASC69345.1 ABC transporter protein [Halomicronema hongdechloris C2206]
MIEVEHLSKTYGSTEAIRDVAFRVETGEILGFLGPNGAGKTTTMRILAGYLPATSGTARIAGYDVHSDSMAVRQRIGYLPENPPLYLEMTVEGFLHFVGRIKGMAAGDRPHRVQIAMERCGLLEKRSVLIRKLSKGYRQRVGIAQAIIHDPPVIILDEPTVGLDPRQIIEVRQLIKGLAGEHTLILSTHILPEVSVTCNRVAIIHQGQIVATDSPQHLMSNLGRELTYEVEVAGDQQRAQQLLGQLPAITRVEPLSQDSQDQHGPGRSRLQVIAHPQEDPGHAIALTLVQNGLELYELRRQQVSLEEVFLNLTTQEAAPDALGIRWLTPRQSRVCSTTRQPHRRSAKEIWHGHRLRKHSGHLPAGTAELFFLALGLHRRRIILAAGGLFPSADLTRAPTASLPK